VQSLENIFVSQITCGWSHSVALDAKGRVFTWGNSDHGKLGHGTGRKVSVPQLVDKLKDYRVVCVASYNEHTSALVEPFDHRLGLAGAVNAVPVTAAYTSQIRAMVNDEEFSDVTFIVENGPVYAHRAILAQRCEHFAAMFRRYIFVRCFLNNRLFLSQSHKHVPPVLSRFSGMRESVERTITIPNMKKKSFLLLLEYLYTDAVKIEVENAIDLYIIADLYHIERLREMCCTVVRRNLSAENSGPLLQNASASHCHVLKEVCMKYVVENFDAVSKTEGIKQVSHTLLLEILSQR